MQVDSFCKNSIIVILSNLTTGVLNFIFSIILSKKLGTEGLGLYGLIMPVYFFLLCLVCEGIVTAISKNTATFFYKNDFGNLNRTIKIIFTLIFFWAAFISALVFINSSYISNNFIRDIRVTTAIKILCPALIFVSLSSVLKGYFYGTGKFYITSSVDIFEKILRIAVLIGIPSILSIKGIKDNVSIAYLALTVGEFSSFSVLFIILKKMRRRFTKRSQRHQNTFQLLFNILAVSFPLSINGLLSSFLSTITALVLPRRLAVSLGISYNSSLSLIGKFSGMALNITLFPLIIVNSLSTVLIPDISKCLDRKDYWSIENRIIQILKISFITGTATLIISQCIPNCLGKLFYNRSDLGTFIMFTSLSSVINFVSTSTFGIMNALGKQKIILRNSLIISIEELLCIYILSGIPSINIYSIGLTLIITSITALFLNFYEINKICNLNFQNLNIIKYIWAGMPSYAIVKLISNTFPDSMLLLKTIAVTAFGFITMFVITSFMDIKSIFKTFFN